MLHLLNILSSFPSSLILLNRLGKDLSRGSGQFVSSALNYNSANILLVHCCLPTLIVDPA